jgi:MFS family permease
MAFWTIVDINFLLLKRYRLACIYCTNFVLLNHMLCFPVNRIYSIKIYHMNHTQHGEPATKRESSWSVLRYPQFRALFLAQFSTLVGAGMVLATVNWQVFLITDDELYLGLVGLARVLPIILLALIGGVIADSMDRRRLLMRTNGVEIFTNGLLAISALIGFLGLSQGDASADRNFTLPMLYLGTAILAGVQAFQSPARTAIMPNLVPRERLTDATRVGTAMFPTAAVVGPVLAGLLLAFAKPAVVYALGAVLVLPTAFVLRRVKLPPLAVAPNQKGGMSWESLKEGVRFVWGVPVLRWSLIMDFVATFFSSATALLPVYAREILKVGAEGYGFLAAMPAAGSILGTVLMTQYANRIKAHGKVMLISVFFYGLVTVFFGISTDFMLCAVMLALTGFTDSISMMIRSPMRQLVTPDHLRGRMISVTMIFFMGGPQLGEFEAGWLASRTSAPFSVVSGGVLTMLIIAAMAAGVPALRKYRETDYQHQEGQVQAPTGNWVASPARK